MLRSLAAAARPAWRAAGGGARHSSGPRAGRHLASLSHTGLTIELTGAPADKPADEGSLGFGKVFTDHMLTIEWDNKSGWHEPRICPFQNLSLPPSTCVFHYAQECFEGMKAYRGVDGTVRLFRPDLNMTRLNNSTARIGLPTFNGAAYVECLKSLVALDKDWIPHQRGYSMYIRPTVIGTEPTLGVKMTSKALFFTILSPVGAYYASGFKPVRLLASTDYQRAWPGGTGDAKVGGNYAPTLLPQSMAADQGYSQVLWLFGEDHEITEVGTMNLFLYWTNESGEKELVTPPLDGTILPGVTRQSILDLGREWGEFKVTERRITMKEVTRALDEGRLLEMFGSGTAATVSPIAEINFNGTALAMPNGGHGVLAQRIMDLLFDIQYGVIPEHPWAPHVC